MLSVIDAPTEWSATIDGKRFLDFVREGGRATSRKLLLRFEQGLAANKQTQGR
jgi:hypothetical protein